MQDSISYLCLGWRKLLLLLLLLWKDCLLPKDVNRVTSSKIWIWNSYFVCFFNNAPWFLNCCELTNNKAINEKAFYEAIVPCPIKTGKNIRNKGQCQENNRRYIAQSSIHTWYVLASSGEKIHSSVAVFPGRISPSGLRQYSSGWLKLFMWSCDNTPSSTS